MPRKKGLFITFEGAEGSGKSTQIQRAAEYLQSKGQEVLLLREPGGTRISEAIREIILNKEFTEMKAETELLLYLAARAQIVREKILPALNAGKTVICDRFEDSTLAYQGFGRKLPIKSILAVSADIVRGELQPDLTFLLDVDPVIGMKRGGRHDRIELETDDFHSRVHYGFVNLARKDQNRFVIIDTGANDIETVTAEIKKVLDRVL